MDDQSNYTQCDPSTYGFVGADYEQSPGYHSSWHSSMMPAMYQSQRLAPCDVPNNEFILTDPRLARSSTLLPPAHQQQQPTPWPAASVWNNGFMPDIVPVWNNYDWATYGDQVYCHNAEALCNANCDGTVDAKQLRRMAKHSKRKVDLNKVSIGVQYETQQHSARNTTPQRYTTRHTVIICRDCEAQTDFSDELSKLSLVEHPSPLYNPASITDVWKRCNDSSNQHEATEADEVYSSNSQLYYMNSGTHATADHSLLSDRSVVATHGHQFQTCGYTMQPPYLNGNKTVVQSAAAVPSGNSPAVQQSMRRKSSLPLVATDSQFQAPCSMPSAAEMHRKLSVGGKLATLVSVGWKLATPVTENSKTTADHKKVAAKTVVVSVKDSMAAKNSQKKKQRRQAQLSRAADQELAEISLEQQVLHQMTRHKTSLLLASRSSQLTTQGSSTVENQLDIEHDSTELKGAWRCRRDNNDASLFLSELSDSEKHSESIGSPLSGCSDRPSTLSVDCLMASTRSTLYIPEYGSRNGSNAGSSQASSHDYYCASTDLSPISQTSPLTLSSPSESPHSSGIRSPCTGFNGFHSPRTNFSSSFHKPANIVSKIHSRRFREYCNQVLSREIDDCCTLLLQHLVRFQDTLYQTNAATCNQNVVKRRTVLGLREVTKNLKMCKLKAVIISPNLEKIESKGDLDETLHSIIEMCHEQRVPLVFALGRRALGRACAKPVPVSVVGIFSYEGVETHFKKMCELTEKARQTYQEIVAALEHEVVNPDTNDIVIATDSMTIANGNNYCRQDDVDQLSEKNFDLEVETKPVDAKSNMLRNDPNMEKGIVVENGVGTDGVGTCGVGTGAVSTGGVGTHEVGTREVGTGGVSTGGVGIGGVGTREVGTRGVSTTGVGTTGVGTGGVSTGGEDTRQKHGQQSLTEEQRTELDGQQSSVCPQLNRKSLSAVTDGTLITCNNTLH